MANILFGRPGSDGQMKRTGRASSPRLLRRDTEGVGSLSLINGDNERVEQWLEVVSWELRAFVYHNFLESGLRHALDGPDSMGFDSLISTENERSLMERV
ncbi:hypothetical protein JHK87_006511 [Glycine soja]|nr:hypothetical protein JHK87_006511 [Glycine soja]